MTRKDERVMGFAEKIVEDAQKLGIELDECDFDMARVNQANMDDNYDRYEALIERYARKYGVKESLFEDWCTDQRILGVGRC